MIQERLAQIGVGSGPLGLLLSWLPAITDILQVVLVLTSIVATALSAVYYYNENKRKK
jgi:hypothetical protein